MKITDLVEKDNLLCDPNKDLTPYTGKVEGNIKGELTDGMLNGEMVELFEVKKLFNISEHVFHPKPKVKSAFIQLKPKMYLFDSKTHEKVFFEIVKNAFSGRRKMIKRSLSKYLTQNDFDDLNINPESRAENLSVNDYISISRYVKKI